jgi:predicted metal-dependent peptidase
MKPDPDLARLISASLLRLSSQSPFFGTLALFASIQASEQIPTAATDGKTLYFNPEYFKALNALERDGILLHEVLHAVLLHVIRRGGREPKLWNIAADIVINGMIIKAGFTLPKGGLRDSRLEDMDVESVYEYLLQHTSLFTLPFGDLLGNAPADAQGDTAIDQAGNIPLETHWRNALQQAKHAEQTTMHGNLPAGLERELKGVDSAQIDWRTYLWRFLVRTPTDFGEFDRRFVGLGLYLETLTGESLRVMVAVDTSGSIMSDQLQTFVSEVQAILMAYPHIRCELFYVDTVLHGPFPLSTHSPIPSPVGWGGTNFQPFFERVIADSDPFTPTLCVYLTDGYGRFPIQAPEVPVLWVVTPHGLEAEYFPFGEVIKLI